MNPAAEMVQPDVFPDLADDSHEAVPGVHEGETHEQMLARGERAYHRLVERRRRFVDEYLIDGNKTQAAKRAGYAPGAAHVEGHRLLKDADIAAAVEWRKTCFAKFAATPGAVLEQLTRIAMADVRDFFDDDGNLIPVHELPEDLALIVQEADGCTVRKLSPRMPALEALARFHGLYERGHRHGGEGDPRPRTTAGGGDAVALARSILMRLRDVRDRKAIPAEG